VIDLSLSAHHDRLKGFNKVTIANRPLAGLVVVEQPDFDSRRVLTSLLLRSGERVLLGTFRTGEPPKHVELFILKAEAVAVE